MVVIENSRLQTKQLTRADWEDVAHLIHSGVPVHRHLGWRSPLDWLDHQPFIGAYRGGEMVGVIACPPNEDRVTWLRLLAVANEENLGKTWRELWAAARESLISRKDVSTLNVLAMHTWLRDLLQGEGFQRTHEVVVMEWQAERAEFPDGGSEVTIRPMGEGDIPGVYAVDRAAFDPLWRNSRQGLRVAYDVARIASVAEVEERIGGYQISTADSLGGHLARLAVHPEFQSRGVGTALVDHIVRAFERQGMVRISVNTQRENIASIKLYEKFGFQRKGETFPVFRHFF